MRLSEQSTRLTTSSADDLSLSSLFPGFFYLVPTCRHISTLSPVCRSPFVLSPFALLQDCVSFDSRHPLVAHRQSHNQFTKAQPRLPEGVPAISLSSQSVTAVEHTILSAQFWGVGFKGSESDKSLAEIWKGDIESIPFLIRTSALCHLWAFSLQEPHHSSLHREWILYKYFMGDSESNNITDQLRT
jgi:hypothetical protein